MPRELESNHMRTKFAFGLVAVLLGSLSTVRAAEFWEKKDYRQWSEKECRKLLRNSPWAKQYVLANPIIKNLGGTPSPGRTGSDAGSAPITTGGLSGPPSAGSSRGGPGGGVQGPPPSMDGDIRGREQNPRMFYQAQIISALPIRQAKARLRQIEAGYDNMSPENKEEFDAAAERYLDRDFPDTVVVQVFYGSNTHFDARDMAQHWQNQTVETLQNFVFLIGGKGKKVPLLQFATAEGRQMFQMVFSRLPEGQPLVGPKDKSLKLEFPHPKFGDQREERVLLEFKTKKMRVGGEVVF